MVPVLEMQVSWLHQVHYKRRLASIVNEVDEANNVALKHALVIYINNSDQSNERVRLTEGYQLLFEDGAMACCCGISSAHAPGRC